MAIDRDGDGPPLRREDARSKPPADGLRASPFTEDVFDDEYYGRRPRSSGVSFGTVVGVVFFAAVVAAAGWYILAERSTPAIVAGDGELVRADPAPYKVKPENPGGLQVANQDKLIYDDRLGKGPPPKQKENLLPAPEEPRAPPVKPPEPTAEAKPEPKLEAKSEPKPEPKPAAEKPAAAKADAEPDSADPMADLMAKVEGMRKPEEESPPAPAPQSVSELIGRPSSEPKIPTPPSAGISGAATPAPSAAAPPAPSAPAAGSPRLLVPAAGNPPAPAPSTAVAAASPPVSSTPPASSPAAEPVVAGPAAVPGAIYVQLASARSQDGAMSEWKRISGKNQDLLAGMSPAVTQADVPDKGTFFRLRAGPVSDRLAAQELCGNLIARGNTCLIVRP